MLSRAKTATRNSLDKHEKLRRLGEATTDVVCAGVELVFDKLGPRAISQRIHRLTKSVQQTSSDIFQAPFAQLQLTLLEQQARVEELSARIATDNALPAKVAEQASLIEQFRAAVPTLEKRVADQQADIQTLEAQVEEGRQHEARVHRREAEIVTLVDELEKQHANLDDQKRLIEDLRETIQDLEGLKDDVENRDALIEQLRSRIAADADEHKAALEEHDRAVALLHDELTPLRSNVEEQLSRIAELSAEAEAGKTLEARVAEQDKLIANMREMLAAEKRLEEKVAAQDDAITELRGTLAAREIELKHQSEHAALLQRELDQSEAEKATQRAEMDKVEAELNTVRTRVKEMESRRATPPPAPRRQSSQLPWYAGRYGSFTSGSTTS